MQNFLQYYAKFMFLSLVGFDSPSAYDAVKGVQTFLNKEGFKDGKGEELAVDGVVGANTANAVMGYQRAKGLTVDGIVGDETWNSMYMDKIKKEEALFGGTEKTDEGIVLPTTPEGSKRDTYTPKSERSEDQFTKVVDKWKKMGNPFNGLKKEKDESFHDKVRRRWGNGVNPSRVLSISRDNTPGISTSPFSTYKSTGIAFNDYAFSEDESEFSGSNRRTDKLFATEEPELTLMSNSGKQKSDESNAEETEKITITEADKNIINGSMASKGWNAFWDADSQDIVNTDYSVYYDFEKTPAKSVLSEELNNALETATTNDDYYSQQVIKITIDNVESFDDSEITSVYYLNDEDGAMTAGHSGILMVNSEGKGILFSFYPQSQKFPDGVFYSPSEMRISVLSGQGLDNFLNGSTILTASTSGKKRTESYDRVLQYEITPEQGKAMFEQAVAITGLGFSYDLAYRNCDHIALSILGMGDVDLWKFQIPNNSFDVAVATALVSALYEKARNLWK